MVTVAKNEHVDILTDWAVCLIKKGTVVILSPMSVINHFGTMLISERSVLVTICRVITRTRVTFTLTSSSLS